jgi:hypothetical protein
VCGARIAVLVGWFAPALVGQSSGVPRMPWGDPDKGPMGDARGRWEGDTLVVESTGYLEQSAFGGASERLKAIERFRPTGRGTIESSITVGDADTRVRPWTFGMRLTKDDTSSAFEYACHEGNEGLRGILSAARAAERQAAAGNR